MVGFIPDLNWSAFLSSSLYGSFQFGILCSPELVSFPFKFPVWKLPIWNPSSPELVSFPFKFPVWKLPIWNPSSPVLNWSAFLSSFPVWKQFPAWKLPAFVWKLPIWNPSSPELVSFPFKFPVWKLPIWNPSSPVLNWSGWNPSSPVLNWSLSFQVPSMEAGQLSFQIPFVGASSPGLVSFPFKFLLWKLSICNLSSPILGCPAFLSNSFCVLSECLKEPVHLFWCGAVLHFGK